MQTGFGLHNKNFGLSPTIVSLKGWSILCLVLISFAGASGQEVSLDNHTGNWLDNTTWVDGTSPGAIINSNVDLYGFVRAYTSCVLNGSARLDVYDTLLIYGNLTLNNSASLSLSAGAILIVYGDYSSKNWAEVGNGGIMVVTGEWTSSGAKGSFDNDGDLYIFDPNPSISPPGGSGYSDITCDTALADCNVSYDSTDLINGPVGDLFLDGGYAISASGPTSFCPGGSVTLSASAGLNSYQWSLDGNPINGASSPSYVASNSGSYGLRIELPSGSFRELTPVMVSAEDNEAPVISSCPASISLVSDDSYLGSNVSWVPPTASDNCSYTMSSSHAPGDFFPLGITTVSYLASDAGGLSASCTFEVEVLPASSPGISGNQNVCTPVQESYSVADPGSHTFTWTVTNGTIVGPASGSSVIVEWNGSGSGAVQVEVSSAAGGSVSGSLSVNQYPSPEIEDLDSNNILYRE